MYGNADTAMSMSNSVWPRHSHTIQPLGAPRRVLTIMEKTEKFNQRGTERRQAMLELREKEKRATGINAMNIDGPLSEKPITEIRAEAETLYNPARYARKMMHQL